MQTTGQLAMGFDSPESSAERTVSWLGLVLEHRSLLEALQDEWLLPLVDAGHLLMIGAMTDLEVDLPEHRIQVGLKVNPSSLPCLEVLWYAKDGWIGGQISSPPVGARAVWWPGSLPLSAVSTIVVRKEEERARLGSMVRQVSNIELPEVAVRAVHPAGTAPPPPRELAEQLSGCRLVDQYDARRGAAAMAWWAVPRTAPWYELLASSFGTDGEGLRRLAADVDAPWLARVPWAPSPTEALDRSPDGVLWAHAIAVALEVARPDGDALWAALRERVAAHPDFERIVAGWLEQTDAVLDGGAAVDMSSAETAPVGLALQLVLTRTEPERYRSWLAAGSRIPPAVWWTGALLVGAACGYRRLPTMFRGEHALRRYLALELGAQSPVAWRWQGGAASFLAGNDTLSTKPRSVRQAWLEADLSSEQVAELGLREADRLGWSVSQQELHLGTGAHRVIAGGPIVTETVLLAVERPARIVLAGEAKLVRGLDPDAFRHALITRGGELKASPPTEASSRSRYRYRVEPNVAEVPGLIYEPGFLDERAQSEVLEAVDSAEWSDVLKRRVQHYGWRYDYKARKVTKEMKLGPLPGWAGGLASRLWEEGLLPWLADQVIVNEYLGKQGIAGHIDLEEAFEGAVAMVSLVESWEMRFRPPGKKSKVDRLLERGSVAVMTGPARHEWTHEIPVRKKERGRERQRRVSITFRKVRVS